MSGLAYMVEAFHFLVVIAMLAGLRVAVRPTQYPRLWKYAVALWVVVPLAQGACGGRCPLSVLSHRLSGKPGDVPSFTRMLLGKDIPWWVSLAIGTVVATVGVVSFLMCRRKWIRYQAALAAWEAQAVKQKTRSPQRGQKGRKSKR